MSNDLQQARIEAAAKVLLRDYQSEYDGGEVSEFLDVARAALAAADAHLPTAEQIAEVLSAQTTCDGEPWPSELHRRQARAVRALFGEVAGDDTYKR